MNITERAAIVLQQIDAALAMAENATPGPWTLETVPTSCGVCHKVGPFPYRNGKFNYACVYADYPSNGPLDVELQANATFIAASRTGWPLALRCLKTAIERLLKARDATIQLRAHADPLLTTLCDQWEES